MRQCTKNMVVFVSVLMWSIITGLCLPSSIVWCQSGTMVQSSSSEYGDVRERVGATFEQDIQFLPTHDSINQRNNRYYVMVNIGTGLTRSISDLATPQGIYTAVGGTAILRIMGSSYRLLSFGIETGYQFISSNTQRMRVFGIRDSIDFSGMLYGFPFMAVIGLREYGWTVHGGFGYYRLYSRVDLSGDVFTNAEWDQAFSVSLGYTIPVSSRSHIVIEGRFARLVDRQKSLYSLNVGWAFPLFRFY